MPTPILMPALSPTMEEGTLAKWLVKEGDTVEERHRILRRDRPPFPRLAERNRRRRMRVHDGADIGAGAVDLGMDGHLVMEGYVIAEREPVCRDVRDGASVDLFEAAPGALDEDRAIVGSRADMPEHEVLGSFPVENPAGEGDSLSQRAARVVDGRLRRHGVLALHR